MYKRPTYDKLLSRLREPRRFIQVLAGPRQTGKTTITRQIMDSREIAAYYASADEPLLKDTVWIEQQWQTARFKSSGSSDDLLQASELRQLMKTIRPSIEMAGFGQVLSNDSHYLGETYTQIFLQDMARLFERLLVEK